MKLTRKHSRDLALRAAFVLTLVVIALATRLALAHAGPGETAHVSLGIVGSDDLSSRGTSRGVRVIEVFGPRAGRDLRRGDLVIRVDGRRVRDGIELRDLLGEPGNEEVSIEVLRHGRLREIVVPRLDSRSETEDVLGDDDRIAIRGAIRDVRRDVLRSVQRNRIQVFLGDRSELHERMRRLQREMRELELRLEAEGWR